MAQSVGRDGVAVMVDDLNAELNGKRAHGAIEFPLMILMNRVAESTGRQPVVVDVEFPATGEISMIFRFRKLNWFARLALRTCEKLVVAK